MKPQEVYKVDYKSVQQPAPSRGRLVERLRARAGTCPALARASLNLSPVWHTQCVYTVVYRPPAGLTPI